jgi:ribosomal protein S18 acetylase RimI-like enzyme
LSVDKNNLKAISLYEKFGFKKSKDGDNKIFMNLNLGEKNG